MPQSGPPWQLLHPEVGSGLMPGVKDQVRCSRAALEQSLGRALQCTSPLRVTLFHEGEPLAFPASGD